MTVPGRIDPDNPDLDNLPPSHAILFEDQDNNPKAIKPIVGGEGHTYLNKDGLTWDGTSATTLDEVAASYSVHGVLYRQDKGSSKLVKLDTDSDIAYFSKGMVVSQTTGNTGVVGSTMIAEGVHYVDLGLVNDTKVTTEKKEVK
ncbi:MULTISPECIES: hypothetical protein [unclassified Lysinibacillus]|uniref:hypothetical protein n=1 Tax=unclassified Lysinibacillus TaxID=2636778 RepID=UPI002553BA8B|nr:MULTISPECIES: hypothetical protein [unclassified Lysinibacillus]MDM5249380.1 hypothetical protein [Lysinibacillus sp. G4S2]